VEPCGRTVPLESMSNKVLAVGILLKPSNDTTLNAVRSLVRVCTGMNEKRRNGGRLRDCGHAYGPSSSPD